MKQSLHLALVDSGWSKLFPLFGRSVCWYTWSEKLNWFESRLDYIHQKSGLMFIDHFHAADLSVEHDARIREYFNTEGLNRNIVDMVALIVQL